MYKKIIVPLDGSELAECVIPHVEGIFKGMGTEEVILITVMERVVNLTPKNSNGEKAAEQDYFAPDIAFSDRPYTGRKFEFDASLKVPLVTGKMLKQGQRYLAEVAEGLEKKDVKAGITVLMGEAAEQIVDFARSENAELIIMASHGRSGFSRWAMGSVAEKVFHGSSVPILLVKAKAEEKE
ncbi:MAG: universal stress protein [Dehalococcoidales bacterium]|jgi:nucleotide-binding universal stress UspA family protein